MYFSGLHLIIYFSIYFLLERSVDGNNVSLTPDREALVKEGEALHLQCSHSGSSNPHTVNWYLNHDPYGLVLDAADCSSIREAHTYELNRYTLSCRGNNFTLSIYNISKTNDHGDIWECDTTIFGMETPGRASTTIIVIKAVFSGGGGSDHAVKPQAIFAAIPVIVIVSVVTIIACRVYRKKRMTSKKMDPVQKMKDPLSLELTDQVYIQIQKKTLPEQVPLNDYALKNL